MTQTEDYQPLPIQEYLETEKIKSLPQEVKDEITTIRSTYDYMSFTIYQELLKIGVLEKKVKLRHPRTLYVRNDEVIYFNNYNSRFEVVARFKEEE